MMCSTGVTLADAVNHAKLVKSLTCKLCGQEVAGLVEKVYMLRRKGCCPSCDSSSEELEGHMDGLRSEIEDILR